MKDEDYERGHEVASSNLHLLQLSQLNDRVRYGASEILVRKIPVSIGIFNYHQI